jgi:hypothetical protein
MALEVLRESVPCASFGTLALDASVGRKKINKIIAPARRLILGRNFIGRELLNMAASLDDANTYMTIKQQVNRVVCDNNGDQQPLNGSKN